MSQSRANLLQQVNNMSVDVDGKIENLFDQSKITRDGYIDNTGAIVSYTSGGISDYIPLEPDTAYTWTNEGNSGAPIGYTAAWYDSSKQWISTITGKSTVETYYPPSNAAFLRINFGYAKQGITKITKGTTLKPRKVFPGWLDTPSKFQGLKGAFLGDSITYGYLLDDRGSQRFSYLVKEKLGLSYEYNYGMSGTLIAHQDGMAGAFVDRYTSITSDADFVVVMGGINDYYNGTGVMGAEDSTTITEFYGALNTLITGLQNKFPDKEIIFMTPLNGHHSSHTTDLPNTYSGETLEGYRNAILKRCAYHGVPVLDMYAMSGLDFAHNDNHVSIFSADGLHPNAAGHKRIAERLSGYLKTL